MVKETKQELEFKKRLDPQLAKHSTISYGLIDRLRIANNHLKTIFGDRANWKRCADAYYNSEFYKNNCHVVSCIDDIPVLTFNDIKEMILDEEKNERKINRLLDIVRLLETSSIMAKKELLLEAADILGLTFNKDGLVSWMIDTKNIREEAKKDIYTNIDNHLIEFEIVIKNLSLRYFDGIFTTYPHVGTLMTQRIGRYYFRGENAFYGSSRPGAYRNRSLPDYIMHRLADIYREEGGNFLDNFEAIHHWNYGEVLYIPICQHYGLKTEIIDLTTNLKTALFFSCCAFENGKWRPLRRNEFINANKRRHIKSMGGDTRYGIIYRYPTEINDMEWEISDADFTKGLVLPIGYQPFMRCKSQFSYAMFERDSQYDMLKDKRFDKYRFELTEEICEWIFKEMDCGKKIYPENDIPDLSKYFNYINDSKELNESTIDFYLKIHNVPINEHRAIKDEFIKHGYKIIKGKQFITKEEVDAINNKYTVFDAYRLTGVVPIELPLIHI